MMRRADKHHGSCSPRRVVKEFLSHTSILDAEVWLSYFSDNACYSNTGVKNPRGEVGGCYQGKAEIGAFLGFFIPLLSQFQTTVLNETHRGDVVMVRRIDNQTVGPLALEFFPTAKVGANFDLQVMGFFTVEDCKITQWSEYFNVGDFETGSGIPLPK